MSTSRKPLLGILSFLPLVLLIVYLVTFFSFFIGFFRHGQDPELLSQLMMENIAGIILFAVLMSFASLALLIYFIIHAVNNKRLDSSERIVWILVFVFAGMIGFPLYWYMRIWNMADVVNV